MPIYEAMLDTYKLRLSAISDSFENSIAEYDYPFHDGAALDYMGEKARKITFDCFFMNARYNEHYAFLEHIRKGLIYELKHPKYGILKGRIQSPVVRHDERQKFVAITITFIEEAPDVEAAPAENIADQVESAYVDGQQESMDSLGRELETEFGDEAAEALGVDVDADASLLSQFANLSSAVWDTLADFDRMLGVIDNFLASVTLPADAVISAVDFGTRLPGRIIGAIANAVEKIADAKLAVTNLPSTFLSNLNAEITGLKDALSRVSEDTGAYGIMEKSVATAAAQTGALHAGLLYDADEQQRDEYEKYIDINAFDFEGNRIVEAPEIDIYNVNELENSLYLARQLLQTSLNYNREFLQSNKRMAAALERHVRSVKLQRDRIITIDTGTVETPVHAICRNNGLSHRYFEKIMAINDILNPTFASGEIQIYERA